MRIVISSDIYPPVVSGVSTVVDKQSRLLAAQGHDVVVIAPGYPPYSFIPISRNLRHYSILALPNVLRDNSYIGYVPAFHIRTMLSDFKPDLIHFHSVGPVGYPTLKAAAQLNIPSVGTLHGIPQFITAYVPWLTKTSKRFTHRFLWMLVRNFYNRMDGLTTPSYFAADEMKKHGVTAPITVLPMWIDPIVRSHSGISLRKRYAIARNAYIFLYFGRIDQDKNLPVLLHAASRLRRDGRPWHFIFAGKGSYLQTLQALAKKLSVEDRVTWTGYVDEKEKQKIFSESDAFVMPSPLETQSLTTLEAIQMKLPVILADAGALPEIARRFPANCTLFPYNKPEDLMRVLESHLQTPPSGLSPGNFSSIYSRKHHMELLEKLYRSLARR
jgi:glycosyltransferase involved in cell wall biosynthesis